MNDNRCDRGPGFADQRAALAALRGILDGDQAAAHFSAGDGQCGACTVVSAVQLGLALAAGLTGADYIDGDLHLRILGLLEPAQAILDAAPN